MKKVDEFIDNCSPELKEIIIQLRKIILHSIPGIMEKISYGIPFYNYKGPLCYINPKKECVDLGFVKGFYLGNKQGVLESKDRVQVKTISIYNPIEINSKVIIEIILEAAMINEFNNKKKG